MPTPLIVVLAIGLAIALMWPWLPGSYNESVIIISCVGVTGLIILPGCMFAMSENAWGYGLLAFLLLFVFLYPMFYFPWAYDHSHRPRGR